MSDRNILCYFLLALNVSPEFAFNNMLGNDKHSFNTLGRNYMKRNLLATAIVLTLLTGCDDNTSTESTQATSSSSAPASFTATSEPSQAQAAPKNDDVQADQQDVHDKKMNTYIDCYNTLQLSIYNSMERYASWLKDLQTGPTGKERIVYGTYAVSDSTLEKCQKEVPEVVKLKPALEPMDEAASAFITHAVAVANTINAMNKYYEQENYKDDAFAEGKTLHQTLMKQWSDFEPAANRYSDAIKQVEAERQVAQLKAIEQSEGKSENYYTLSVMIHSGNLNDVISHETFDTDNAMKQLTELEKTTAEFKEKLKAQSGDSFKFTRFISTAEEYQLDTKKYIRRVRDKAPYADSEKRLLSDANAGWMVDASYPKALRSYNQMVDNYNRMH